MPQTTSETLLISAMINTRDHHAGRAYGITPPHMRRYRDEYEWVQDYAARFGETPSPEKLRVAFPEFPFSETEDDPRWSAQEIHESYARFQLTRALLRSNECLSRGEVKAAYAEIDNLKYTEVSTRPTNMLVDPGYLEDFESGNEVRVNVPYPTLQMLTGGIGPGELWYWLARQGHGKSSHLANIAVTAAHQGSRVLVYALEMTKRQMQVRSHAIMGHRLGWGNRINAHAMLHREYPRLEYSKLLGEIEEGLSGELHVHDMTSGRVTPGSMMGRAGDYDLVIVDHVGLMYTDSGHRSIEDWRYAAEISNGLKEVAGSQSARVLAAVQVNRTGETRQMRPPGIETAAQTDAIGQDADVAITMKRHGKQNTILSLEKNRHGESQRLFWTKYLANVGDFDEVTREKADDMKMESDGDDD